MSKLEEYANGLIALGEFIIKHEELFRDPPTSWQTQANQQGTLDLPDPVSINIHCRDTADLAKRIRELGSGNKYSETFSSLAYTGVKKEFGPHVVDVYIPSDKVCTPARKETRTVQTVKLTHEAKAQIEAIRAEHTVMETTEVVVEWSCPPSLLSPSPAGEAAK